MILDSRFMICEIKQSRINNQEWPERRPGMSDRLLALLAALALVTAATLATPAASQRWTPPRAAAADRGRRPGSSWNLAEQHRHAARAATTAGGATVPHGQRSRGPEDESRSALQERRQGLRRRRQRLSRSAPRRAIQAPVRNGK